MEISTKERLMYFGYMYAPRITHHGEFFITEKFIIETHKMDEETINRDIT
jgi:hypothetical protein